MLSYHSQPLPQLRTALSCHRSTDPFHSRIAVSLLLLIRVHLVSTGSSNLWSSKFAWRLGCSDILCRRVLNVHTSLVNGNHSANDYILKGLQLVQFLGPGLTYFHLKVQMTNGQPPHPNTSSDSGGPPEVSPPRSKYQLSADLRMEIDENPVFKLHLKEWEEQLKEDLLKNETYRNRCIAAKAELYQHMNFYILIQGVVFGALSNGSKLTCQASLFPASFSFLTSVTTIINVHFKLSYYKIEKLKFIRAEGDAKNLVKKISTLRNAGKEFKFEDIDASQPSSQKNIDDEASSQKWFYWAVMFFFVLFSLIILASCIFVLCFDTEKQKLRLCALHKCRELAFP